MQYRWAKVNGQVADRVDSTNGVFAITDDEFALEVAAQGEVEIDDVEVFVTDTPAPAAQMTLTPTPAPAPSPLQALLAKVDEDITDEELRTLSLAAVRAAAERGLIQ